MQIDFPVGQSLGCIANLVTKKNAIMKTTSRVSLHRSCLHRCFVPQHRMGTDHVPAESVDSAREPHSHYRWHNHHPALLGSGLVGPGAMLLCRISRCRQARPANRARLALSLVPARLQAEGRVFYRGKAYTSSPEANAAESAPTETFFDASGGLN